MQPLPRISIVPAGFCGALTISTVWEQVCPDLEHNCRGWRLSDGTVDIVRENPQFNHNFRMKSNALLLES